MPRFQHTVCAYYKVQVEASDEYEAEAIFLKMSAQELLASGENPEIEILGAEYPIRVDHKVKPKKIPFESKWCLGFGFTQNTFQNVLINGYGSCAQCGRWIKSTKTYHPYHHKTAVK